jgi:hypothetical protein
MAAIKPDFNALDYLPRQRRGPKIKNPPVLRTTQEDMSLPVHLIRNIYAPAFLGLLNYKANIPGAKLIVKEYFTSL